MRVAVLVGPEFSFMGTAGALEMLDECASVAPAAAATLQLSQVGRHRGAVPGRFSSTFSADAGLDDEGSYDLVVLPPIKQDISQHLTALAPFVPWLRAQHAAGSLLCSLCTGSFLLAETGLLDGGRAASHWAFLQLFRARYPAVEVVEHAMLVEGKGVVMTGGALAFTNGLLFVVERLMGVEASIALSKLFVVDRFREHQGAFTIFQGVRSHGDEAVLRCQDLIEQSFATATVPQLAQAVGMSPRTLRRHFRSSLGMGPLDYLRRVRVEAARHALERTDRSVVEVMDAVGYSDRKSFAATFRGVTGLSPGDYRKRHSVRCLPARRAQG